MAGPGPNRSASRPRSTDPRAALAKKPPMTRPSCEAPSARSSASCTAIAPVMKAGRTLEVVPTTPPNRARRAIEADTATIMPAVVARAAGPTGQSMSGMTTSSRPSSSGGHCMSRPSRTSTRMLAMTRLRYHLRSAGMTYQGASSVEVSDRASSKAAM